jgi:2-succinyl-5-enolpyruvyl-6-hydroxy-3-cyclohexene-1-carboxylate synthase
VLRTWLESSDAVTWMVAERPDNRDALHLRARQVIISPGQLAAALPVATDVNGYQRMWARYDAKARAALDEHFRSDAVMFEPKVAWLLGRHLPEGTPIFIASSMPVRDVEYVWPANNRMIRPFCNRGANGIDGTLSTALGCAHGGEHPAALLTGDLALLHDTNGFLLRPKFRGALTIVLINNRGGGIFEHLPIAEFQPPFEEFFATPQDVDFAKLAATYGVEHITVRDWPHFRELISTLPASGIRLLEVKTDRKRDAAMRKELFGKIASVLA